MVRPEAHSLGDQAQLEPWIACRVDAGRQSMWCPMKQVMTHGKSPHWKMPEVECQPERSLSRSTVGARVAHRAGDRTAEAGEAAGRQEVAAAALAQAAVALAQEEAAQARVVMGPAEDLGATIPGAEDVVARDEEGGRRMATPRTTTDRATGTTSTTSLLVEEVVEAVRHPRRTRCLRSWKG